MKAIERTEQNATTPDDVIASQIRGDGERLMADVPAQLHGDIMAAVRCSATTAQEPVARIYPWAWSAAAAAALVVASLVLVNRQDRASSQHAAASVSSFESQLRQSFELAPALLLSPIEREGEYLVEDIRRTTEFLLAKLD